MLHRGMACATLGAACLIALPAQATLGQDVVTVDRDQARMHASAHVVTTHAAYTVHLLRLPSGTAVREYVAPGGIVFGVAWEGPTLPDLKATLGLAFDQYVAVSATRRTSPATVSNSHLVIVSGGHLRAFAGHAYVPQAVPAGVDVGLIQ
jgi:Protein of unknown function (DUF2844)